MTCVEFNEWLTFIFLVSGISVALFLNHQIIIEVLEVSKYKVKMCINMNICKFKHLENVQYYLSYWSPLHIDPSPTWPFFPALVKASIIP